MKVTEIRVFDVNGKLILNIKDETLLLETKEGFINVSYVSEYSEHKRHVLIPSTNISQVLYWE